MIRHFILILATALASAAGTQMARGFTTNLVPIADTFLRDQAAANSNYGGDSPLLVGIAKEPFFIQNRALLKFDFAGIPTNATITGVTLTIVITRSNTDPSNFDLNRMLVNWDEYESTWNERFPATPWLAGGCQSGTEYVSAPSVTAEIDGTIFSSAGMIADVQLWLNHPGTNHGWIVSATGNQVATGKQIGSRESEFTPVLTIEYTLAPPPPAMSPTLFGVALTGNQFRFSFVAQSNRVYSVDARDSFAITNWNVLTSIPAQPADRTVTITNTVSSRERYFRARTP